MIVGSPCVRVLRPLKGLQPKGGECCLSINKMREDSIHMSHYHEAVALGSVGVDLGRP